MSPVATEAEAEAGHPGRPFGLAVLWVALMAPLSVAGTALQPLTRIPSEVFPLVMVGPALAGLICSLVVPRWFPHPRRPAPRGRLCRSLALTLLAGAAYVVVAGWLLMRGPALLPGGWPRSWGVVGVVAGLSLGSLLEEIGYRGVMYRALAARMGPMTATLTNGAFFGIAHLQYLGAGTLAVLLFVCSAVFMDVAMVALWTGSWWQRLAVATLVHSLVNVTLSLAGDPLTSLRSFAVVCAASAAAALVAVVLGRRHGLGDYATDG